MPTRPPKHRPHGWNPPAPKLTDTFYGSVAWKELRARIKARDGGRCRGLNWDPSMGQVWFCNREGYRVDHIVSRTKGGADDPRNLRLLCGQCDAKRHIEKATAWRLPK